MHETKSGMPTVLVHSSTASDMLACEQQLFVTEILNLF